MNSTDHLPFASCTVAHSRTNLSGFVAADLEVRWLRSLEFDPALGDVITDNEVVSCRDITTSSAIFGRIVSKALPDTGLGVADG